MADVIVRLLDDPETAAAMGARGRLRVIDQFSADVMADRTRATYDRILHGPEGRRMVEGEA